MQPQAHTTPGSAAAAAAAAESEAQPSTQGPKVETRQRMLSSMRIPAALVVDHMPDLAGLPFGSGGRPLAVQLVLLPPYASDITPETPAQKVIELQHGVTVRRDRTDKHKSDTVGSFGLAGLPLRRSQPAQEGWYVRGVRVLGPWYVQLLCSPALPPELAEAHAAAEAAKVHKRRQTRQRLQQQQLEQGELEQQQQQQRQQEEEEQPSKRRCSRQQVQLQHQDIFGRISGAAAVAAAVDAAVAAETGGVCPATSDEEPSDSGSDFVVTESDGQSEVCSDVESDDQQQQHGSTEGDSGLEDSIWPKGSVQRKLRSQCSRAKAAAAPGTAEAAPGAPATSGSWSGRLRTARAAAAATGKAAAPAAAAGAADAQAGDSVMAADGQKQPYINVVQSMRTSQGGMHVGLPWSFVGSHMPQLAALEPGTNTNIYVQLVLLPPCASDITPETPAQAVLEFQHGVTVRRKLGKDQATASMRVSGLALSRSQPVRKGWYLRGVRKLGETYVQLLCSPELPPELAAAKQSINESVGQKMQQHRRQQQQQQQQQQQGATRSKFGSTSQQQSGAPNLQQQQQHSVSSAGINTAAAELETSPQRNPSADLRANTAAAAAAGTATAATKPGHAPARAVSTPACPGTTLQVPTDAPYAAVTQLMGSHCQMCIPSAVARHMPAIHDMDPSTAKAVHIQLALLPRYAADITPDTPAQKVIELRSNVSVRKLHARGSDLFVLSGLPLTASQPAREAWWLRGVRKLGETYVQLLCSPELPPELAAAKQALQNQQRQKHRQTQMQQQQQLGQAQQQQERKVGTAAGGEEVQQRQQQQDSRNAAAAAATETEPAASISRRGSSTAAGAAAAGASHGCTSGNGLLSPAAPYASVAQLLSSAGVHIPSAVSCQMPQLLDMPYNTRRAVQVHLVLLPPYASDITPETPAQKVLKLRSDVFVRRQRSKVSDLFVLSGLPLTVSQPAREAWWLRGVRKLGETSVQLLCSPELPPELAEAKRSLLEQRKQKQEQTRQQQQQQGDTAVVSAERVNIASGGRRQLQRQTSLLPADADAADAATTSAAAAAASIKQQHQQKQQQTTPVKRPADTGAPHQPGSISSKRSKRHEPHFDVVAVALAAIDRHCSVEDEDEEEEEVPMPFPVADHEHRLFDGIAAGVAAAAAATPDPAPAETHQPASQATNPQQQQPQQQQFAVADNGRSRPCAAHSPSKKRQRHRRVSYVAWQQEQQQQQQQARQQQDTQAFSPASSGDGQQQGQWESAAVEPQPEARQDINIKKIRGRMQAALRDIDRQWKQVDPPQCAWWSGITGSCWHGKKCRNAESHAPGQATGYYTARAAVFEQFDVPMDSSTGNYRPALLGKVLQRKQQQQQQLQEEEQEEQLKLPKVCEKQQQQEHERQQRQLQREERKLKKQQLQQEASAQEQKLLQEKAERRHQRQQLLKAAAEQQKQKCQAEHEQKTAQQQLQTEKQRQKQKKEQEKLQQQQQQAEQQRLRQQHQEHARQQQEKQQMQQMQQMQLKQQQLSRTQDEGQQLQQAAQQQPKAVARLTDTPAAQHGPNTGLEQRQRGEVQQQQQQQCTAFPAVASSTPCCKQEAEQPSKSQQAQADWEQGAAEGEGPTQQLAAAAAAAGSGAATAAAAGQQSHVAASDAPSAEAIHSAGERAAGAAATTAAAAAVQQSHVAASDAPCAKNFHSAGEQAAGSPGTVLQDQRLHAAAVAVQPKLAVGPHVPVQQVTAAQPDGTTAAATAATTGGRTVPAAGEATEGGNSSSLQAPPEQGSLDAHPAAPLMPSTGAPAVLSPLPPLHVALLPGAKGIPLSATVWQAWLPQLQLQPGTLTQLQVQFVQQQQHAQAQVVAGPVRMTAKAAADGQWVRLWCAGLADLLQQLHGKAIVAMSAATAGSVGSAIINATHMITFTVRPAAVPAAAPGQQQQQSVEYASAAPPIKPERNLQRQQQVVVQAAAVSAAGGVQIKQEQQGQRQQPGQQTGLGYAAWLTASGITAAAAAPIKIEPSAEQHRITGSTHLQPLSKAAEAFVAATSKAAGSAGQAAPPSSSSAATDLEPADSNSPCTLAVRPVPVGQEQQQLLQQPGDTEVALSAGTRPTCVPPAVDCGLCPAALPAAAAEAEARAAVAPAHGAEAGASIQQQQQQRTPGDAAAAVVVAIASTAAQAAVAAAVPECFARVSSRDVTPSAALQTLDTAVDAAREVGDTASAAAGDGARSGVVGVSCSRELTGLGAQVSTAGTTPIAPAAAAASVEDTPVSKVLEELKLQQFTEVFEGEMVTTLGILAQMGREDYRDLGVPKGAALMIMAKCRQLMG